MKPPSEPIDGGAPHAPLFFNAASASGLPRPRQRICVKSAICNVGLFFLLGLACIAPAAGCHDKPRQDPAADSAPPPTAAAPPASASVTPPVAATEDAAAPSESPSAQVDDAGVGDGGRRVTGRAPRGTSTVVGAAGTAANAEPVVAAAPAAADPAGMDGKRTKRVLAPMVNDSPYGTAGAPSVGPILTKEPMRNEDPYANSGSGKK